MLIAPSLKRKLRISSTAWSASLKQFCKAFHRKCLGKLTPQVERNYIYAPILNCWEQSEKCCGMPEFNYGCHEKSEIISFLVVK